MDTIVGMDVVIANGSFIHASPTSYPQLYFALRGAADSFGIVTTFYFQTQPAPEELVNFSFEIPATLDSAAVAANSFLNLQNVVFTPEYFDSNVSLRIYTNGQ